VKVAALLSGGKDSLYATYIATQYGWDLTHAITIKPEKLSWMYHTENIHLVSSIAKSMGIPLIEKISHANKEEELDDLKKALQEIAVEGIISGTIASEYQRIRIEKVCHEVGIKSFIPLWHKNGELLLREMVSAGFEIIIVAVAAEGLGEEWLGRRIDEKCIDELLQLHDKYSINISGEGGEYETFVLDCPLYAKKLIVEEAEKKWEGGRGTLNINRIKVEDKHGKKV